jgi:hypothetical protein
MTTSAKTASGTDMPGAEINVCAGGCEVKRNGGCTFRCSRVPNHDGLCRCTKHGGETTRKIPSKTVLDRFVSAVQKVTFSVALKGTPTAKALNTEEVYHREILYRLRKLDRMERRLGNYEKARVKDLTTNPYKDSKVRGIAMAWGEGYEAGRIDDPCPRSRKHNNGRHCGHWQQGDGPCCDCGKPEEGEHIK